MLTNLFVGLLLGAVAGESAWDWTQWRGPSATPPAPPARRRGPGRPR
jgi:hypothetical protein